MSRNDGDCDDMYQQICQGDVTEIDAINYLYKITWLAGNE